MDVDEQAATLGELRIIHERCKGCGYCVEFCPLDVLALSDEFNAKGYHPPYLLSENTCLMCGLCEALCPEFAIYCIPAEEGTGKQENKETRE